MVGPVAGNGVKWEGAAVSGTDPLNAKEAVQEWARTTALNNESSPEAVFQAVNNLDDSPAAEAVRAELLMGGDSTPAFVRAQVLADFGKVKTELGATAFAFSLRGQHHCLSV